jgi:hypothetical protein
MAGFDFWIKAGGTAPPLKVKLENENNSAVNITGQQGAKFYLRSAVGGAMLVNGATATVTDSTGGLAQYSWKAADTSGLDNTQAIAEFHFSLSDGTKLKAPDEGYINILIGDSLG